MVDPKLVDLSSIDDETRYRIFDYLWFEKRVSSTDLGISPTLANKIKNRKAKVTDATLANLLRHLTLEEFARLTGRYVVEKVEPHTVVQILKATLADPDLRWLVVDIVLREVGSEIREFRDTYRVTDEDLRKFEKIISKLSRKTREEYRAIYDALKDLDFELTPDKLREYIEELTEEHREKHPSIPRHIAKPGEGDVEVSEEVEVGEDVASEFEEVGYSLSLERDLEDYLSRNLDAVEEGLRLVERQKELPGIGRLDILARDRKGNFVVIELKAGQADEKAVGQLQAYIEYQREQGYENVRGILIAASYTPKAVYAAKAVKNIKLARYEVQFKIQYLKDQKANA